MDHAGQPRRTWSGVALRASESNEPAASRAISCAMDAARMVRSRKRSGGVRAASLLAATGLWHELHHRKAAVRAADVRLCAAAASGRYAISTWRVFGRVLAWRDRTV